jgi:hypothetical protein
MQLTQLTRRIREGHDSKNFPSTLTTLARYTEGTESTGGELGDPILVGLVNLLWNLVILFYRLQDEERSALDTGNALALWALNNGRDLLGDSYLMLASKLFGHNVG